ncbi:MAG TPA: hypothetical protein VEB40_09590 [Flavipsychrobacter sp.]|nr:hypothetical protein [Flavipsychrobacter sp.]
MKKFAPIVALALLGLTFTSCKKNYTCKCNYSIAGAPMTQNYDLGKQTKGDANTACENYQSNFNNTVAGAASVSCSID